MSTEISLYERIGGQEALKATVDRFYIKLVTDEIVGHYFSNIDLKKLIAHQCQFLSYVFGGPYKYDGRNMQDAHAHLKISENDFSIVANHLHKTLQELHVSSELIDEIMQIVATTHDDIVSKP